MKKVLTLVIIHKEDKVLLGMKKRGFGVGRWNGFGGKVEEGEGIEDAARREVLEEVGVTVKNLKSIGVLEFSWKADAEKVLQVHIFKATEFKGEPKETEEMRPQWFTVSEIPFKDMWSSDVFWYPPFLEDKKFTGTFIFDEKDKVVEYELHES